MGIRMILTERQEHLLDSLRLAAREQLENPDLKSEELTSLGNSFTPLIGELSACKSLGIRWCPCAGYDARDGETRYQIKTRRRSDPQKEIKRGRVGKFRNNDYDFGLLVILDYQFETKGIYRLRRDEVIRLQDKEGGSGIHVSTFMKAAGHSLVP